MKRRHILAWMAVAAVALAAGWGGPARAQGPDYRITVPVGWYDNTQPGAENLIRQLMEPLQNAFVEVYATAVPRNPGVEYLADQTERGLQQQGTPYTYQRYSSAPVTLPPGVPAVMRRYGGNLNGTQLGSFVLTTYYGGYLVVFVGVYVAARSDLERAVMTALSSIRFPGAATTAVPSVPADSGGDSFFGRR